MKNMPTCIKALYDSDKNGSVTILDIMHAQAKVTEDTQFGREIHSLSKEYSRLLMENKAFSERFNIIKYLFSEFIPISWIATELSLKLFDKSYYLYPKIEDESIFKPTKKKSKSEARNSKNHATKKFQTMFKDFLTKDASDIVKKSFGRLSKNLFEIKEHS